MNYLSRSVSRVGQLIDVALVVVSNIGLQLYLMATPDTWQKNIGIGNFLKALVSASTVVEHSPRLLKDEGLSPATSLTLGERKCKKDFASFSWSHRFIYLSFFISK